MYFFSSGLLNFKNWECGFLFIALNLIYWVWCVVVYLGGFEGSWSDWILLLDIVEQGNKLKVRIIYYLGFFLEQFDELGIWKFVFLLGFISYCFGSLCIKFPLLFLAGERITSFPFSPNPLCMSLTLSFSLFMWVWILYFRYQMDCGEYNFFITWPNALFFFFFFFSRSQSLQLDQISAADP